jgi:hypothetical protein
MRAVLRVHCVAVRRRVLWMCAQRGNSLGIIARAACKLSFLPLLVLFRVYVCMRAVSHARARARAHFSLPLLRVNAAAASAPGGGSTADLGSPRVGRAATWLAG